MISAKYILLEQPDYVGTNAEINSVRVNIRSI